MVLAASGIRTLAAVEFGSGRNLVIVATAVGFGLIPVAAPDFWHPFPGWVDLVMSSGISAASVVAVLLNLHFNETGRRRADASVLAASAPKGAVPAPAGSGGGVGDRA